MINKQLSKSITLAILTFIGIGCGRESHDLPNSNSSYLLLNKASSGLLYFVHKTDSHEKIVVCYDDSSYKPPEGEVTTKLGDKTQTISKEAFFKFGIVHSIKTWIEPLKDLNVNPDIEFIEEIEIDSSKDCALGNKGGNGHVKIVLKEPNYRSNVRPGKYPSMNLESWTDWSKNDNEEAIFGITFHEMGHVFGLADTYSSSGGCVKGQPAGSVMCTARKNELQPDDSAGVIAAYKRLYSDTPVNQENLIKNQPDVIVR